ncbi:MAG: AAA family ATPase [Methanoregula sp.]|nr:AAA family ATPase [Methanoregula sp.]
MKNIDFISINNYRAIKNIELLPKSINIFVGPNNCGKSSILEAIAMNLSGKNGFTDEGGANIWSFLIASKKYDPDFLFFNNSKQIKIESNNPDKTNQIIFETFKEGYPDGETGKIIQNFLQTQVSTFLEKASTISEIKESYLFIPKKNTQTSLRQITINDFIGHDYSDEYLDNSFKQQYQETDDVLQMSFINYMTYLRDNLIFELFRMKKMVLTGYCNDKIEYIYVYFYNLPIYGPFGSNADKNRTAYDNINRRFYMELLGTRVNRTKLVQVLNTSEKTHKNLITCLRNSNTPSEISYLHDLVIDNNKINETIENLREKIKYFQDVRKTDTGLQIFIRDQKNPLPISSMGDGFNSLLKLTMMNNLLDNGIIILEEPESSLHPGFLFILSEAILNNSKNSQFFISTHSLDFIKSLLKVAEWNNQLDELQIVRMHTRLDFQNQDIECLSGIEAKEELEEIGIDLRGI